MNIARRGFFGGLSLVAAPLGGQASVARTREEQTSTRVLAETMSWPASLDFIRTAGWRKAGDGGQALYTRSTAARSHVGGGFRSADGAWWELAENTVHAQMFGAVADGVANDGPALQQLVDYAELREVGAWHLELARGQIYRVEQPVRLSKPNIGVQGGRSPAKLGSPLLDRPSGGFLTAPDGLRAILDFAGEPEAPAEHYGQIHIQGLAFYHPAGDLAELNTTPCMRISAPNSAPHRGMNFIELSVGGFADVLVFDAGPSEQVVAATVNLERCHFYRNGNIVRAVTPIYGLNVSNCTSEGFAGGFVGALDFSTRIVANMLESVPNLIDIRGASFPNLYFAHNYLEANGGDFVIRFEAETVFAECVIGPNTGWHTCAATDLVLLRGVGSVRLEQTATPLLTDLQAARSGVPPRRELISLQRACYRGDLNGQGVLAYVDDASTINLPVEGCAADGGRLTIARQLGTHYFQTAAGRTYTGFSTDGFALASIIDQPSAPGDILVLNLLCRMTAPEGDQPDPLIRIFDTTETHLLAEAHIAWAPVDSLAWRLVAAVLPLSASLNHAAVKLYVGALGIASGTRCRFDLAAVGHHVAQKSDLDAVGRLHVIPQCPRGLA